MNWFYPSSENVNYKVIKYGVLQAVSLDSAISLLRALDLPEVQNEATRGCVPCFFKTLLVQCPSVTPYTWCQDAFLLFIPQDAFTPN